MANDRIREREELRRLLADGMPELVQGTVGGRCHMKHEHGRDACSYDWRIDAEDERDRRQISIAPNITFIGTDDDGPILSERHAAIVVAAVNAAEGLLDENDALRVALKEALEGWGDAARGRDKEWSARIAELEKLVDGGEPARLSHTFDLQGPGLAELRAAFDALDHFDPRIPGAPPVLEMLGNATLAVFGERPPSIVEGPGIPEMREVLARLPDSIAIAFDPKVYRWIAAARVVVGGKP